MSGRTSDVSAEGSQAVAKRYQGLRDEALIEAVLAGNPAGRVAVVTSFGIESAVLLDMVARVDKSTPVLFVDTGKLFAQTISYRDQLIDRLGLTDIRTIAAPSARVAAIDPGGDLHRIDAEACCRVRKVEPYARELALFDVVITGRKRYQGGTRSDLKTIEGFGEQLKINPLADWSAAQIDDAFDQRGLSRHPLFFDGFDSVGCAVCSRRRQAGDIPRAGRWEDSEKTECGIHFASCGEAQVG